MDDQFQYFEEDYEENARLEKYFMDLEEKTRVSRHDEMNCKLERDVRKIVKQALDIIATKDKRFSFNIRESGSFFDGVKVGHADEFDYIAEISSLKSDDFNFVPTDDPGFVQIYLKTSKSRQIWSDCLCDKEELKKGHASKEMYHWHDEESDPDIGGINKPESVEGVITKKDYFLTDFVDDDFPIELIDFEALVADNVRTAEAEKTRLADKPKDCSCREQKYLCFQCREKDNPNLILAPTKLQTTFKVLFDEAMFEVDLPTHWEHNGCKRPNYSGCRRHGPATMILLVFNDGKEEYKINVDITIGIPALTPIDFKHDLNMYVFDHVNPESFLAKILGNAMRNGPCVHLIPLYSKMLIKTGKYSNKFSFRISCSSIEKEILDFWPDDSGPKKLMRILKAIRDKYFAEGMRKTHRQKKYKKMKSSKNKYSEMKRNRDNTVKEATKQATKSRPTCDKVNLGPFAKESCLEDTTDLTETEDLRKSKAEAKKLFKKDRRKYQLMDVSDMTAEPGSGEYYGPKTYMASIEIKTVTLRMLAKHWKDENFWSNSRVTSFVMGFLQQYQLLLSSKQMFKNFFYDTMVCSPISDEQRIKALEMFQVLMIDLNDVKRGVNHLQKFNTRINKN